MTIQDDRNYYRALGKALAAHGWNIYSEADLASFNLRGLNLQRVLRAYREQIARG